MSKDLLNRNKRKAKQFEKLQNGFMRIFKIEYAQKAGDESQFVEIRASNADSARRIFYGKHTDLPTIYEIKEVIPTKEHSQSYFKEQEYIKLQKERNARDNQLKYQEQRKAKAEKDRLWKERHPNGRAKNRN